MMGTHRSPTSPLLACHHANDAEYADFVKGYISGTKYTVQLLGYRSRFVGQYPDLRDWFNAPLSERVGWKYAGNQHAKELTSYRARPYLVFLVLRGYACLDWEWLLAVGRFTYWNIFDRLHLDFGIPQLVQEAIELGYDDLTAFQALRWCLLRLFLHTGIQRPEGLTYGHITEAIEAVYRFEERPDLALFHGSLERYRQERKLYLAAFHLLHVILYHRGQIKVEPHKVLPRRTPPPSLKPRMEAVLERYLTVFRLTHRPNTVKRVRHSVHRLISWLAKTYPHLETFAEVTRDQLLAYAEAFTTMSCSRTGQPFAAVTTRNELSSVALFLQDIAQWEWEDAPVRPLMQLGDLPKRPFRIPRYIPDHELGPLMQAIRELENPYQRTALLIARWSGARRDEIRRLALDCLDQYPDGTYRLRIPAGKTRRERVIPLNDEAALAIKELQAVRKKEQGSFKERGFRDSLTGATTYYLFVQRGKHLSSAWLFEVALRTVSTRAGLVTPEGKAKITAHRFRHTVGHQLAERGAKLHTIMTVLGHANPSMSMVYTQISDPEVRKDYQAVLGPGATIAGPAASLLQTGELSASALAWLKTNYLKVKWDHLSLSS